MKYRNDYNLPEEIVHAITQDDYDYSSDEKTISATALINPTKISILSKRHDNEIVEDVSDSIWRLFGQSIHYILSKQDSEGKAIEVRVTVPHNGWNVTGKPDYFDYVQCHLRDFKVTSVWTYIYGAKDGRKAWTEQLNVYAWLLRSTGHEVKKATITTILRDWSAREAARSVDYPQIAIQDIEAPLWTFEEQGEFISARLANLEDANRKSDDDIRECLPEDRWASPTTYAVMKEGREKAARVLNSMEEANQWLVNQNGGQYKIEERKGEDRRCDSYCSVNKWCHYWKGENERD